MRLSLFASLAALGVSGASENFDDDDLNFLRLLSSNASSNASATTLTPTTVAAVNTTVVANTTVAATTVPATTVPAANTTVAPANTTVAPTVTTVANSSAATTVVSDATTVVSDATTVVSDATTVVNNGNATTVVSDATTAGSNEQDTTAAPAATTAAPVGNIDAANLCTEATYMELGLKAPTIVATTADIGMSCPDASFDFSSEADAVYWWGSLATSDANLQKCTTKGGTAKKLKCGQTGTDNTNMIDWFNNWNDMGEKQAVLGLCCGYPSGFKGISLSGAKIYNAGTFTWGEYTDSTCATPAATNTSNYEDTQEYGATMEKQWALGACIAPTGMYGGGDSGVSTMIIAANGTTAADPLAGHFVYGHYFDTSCANVLQTGLAATKACQVKGGGAARMLGAHPSNSTTGGDPAGTVYEKMEVSGSGEVADLQIVSDTELEFTGLDASITPGSTLASDFVDTVAESVRSEVQTAAAVGTTTIANKYGTGQLAATAPAARRRRLNNRRQLGNHGSKVVVVTETVVPAAEAATAKSSLDTAASTGTLSAATLGAAVKTAVQAAPSLAAVTANLTAPTVTVNVAEPVIPVSSPGGGSSPGSTSAATSEYLGFAAGAVLFTSALFL